MKRTGCWMVGVMVVLAVSAGEPDATLQPLVVTATRTEKPLDDAPATVDVIVAEDIQAAGAMTMSSLLGQVTGMDLQGSGFPGNEVKLSLRGFTTGFQTKRVLVLLDGRRVNDVFQGNAELALIPAAAMERIEVLRGPASVLYGSSAVAGVVQIETLRGGERPVSTLLLQAGEHQTYQGRFDHSRTSGKWDYAVSAGTTRTDGYRKTQAGDHQDWTSQNIMLNAGRSLGDSAELRLFAGGSESEGTDDSSERKAERDYQMVLFHWMNERETALDLRVYRNGGRDEYDWIYPGTGVYKQESWAAEISHSYWLSPQQRLTAGGEWRQEGVDVRDVAFDLRERSVTGGLFVQNEWFMHEQLQVTGGIRYDDADDYSGEWSPRVGALWRVLPNWSLYGSISRAYRAPALSDRYVDVEYAGFRFEGNPDLDAETLTAYELGSRMQVSERLRIQVVGFYNLMKDSFDFVLQPDGVFRNQNATESTSQGIELDASYRLNAFWLFTAGAGYTDSRYREHAANPDVEGNWLAYLAPTKAHAGMVYMAPSGLRQSVMIRYVDARYADAQNTTDNRLPSYSVVDWQLRVPLTAQLTGQFRVQNLLDETYFDFPGREQPGRFTSAGLEFRW